jgi:hypothetical protein
VVARRLDDPPLDHHGFGPQVISLFLRLVLVAGISLRGASRVLEMISEALGVEWAAPCWTTGRLWLLRLGHAMLTAELTQADDWAWLIDHSVQIGQEKCLVILGVRLIDLPEQGQSLRHEDLELIELMPAKSWTRGEVDQALENAVRRTGRAPRVIVDDHGGDLAGGVALFQQRHLETVEIYDAKHKAACLLKSRLERNPRWQEFQTGVGQTRCSVQQTELAFLTPPAPKPKARFMNLGPQLAWAKRVLAILRQPPESVLQSVSAAEALPSAAEALPSAARLKEKLGWIEAFAEDLAEWSQWQQVVDVAVAWVNEQGIYKGAAALLAQQFLQLDALGDSASQLAGQLIEFAASQEWRVREGERFPGSTEVLESCFGKFKHLEKQQSRGGFTQLLLGFGALLAKVTTTTVRDALQASRTADIRTWAKQTLGVTVFAQRKLAFASATKTG